MSVYSVLKKLEGEKDEQLEAKVKKYLSSESPNNLVRKACKCEVTISTSVEQYFRQEHEKQYTWKNCIPFQYQADAEQRELMDLIGIPLLTKQDAISFVHKQSFFYSGLFGLLGYLSDPSLLLTAAAGMLMLGIFASTYRDVLNAQHSLFEYEKEVKARAAYIDNALSKNLKNQ